MSKQRAPSSAGEVGQAQEAPAHRKRGPLPINGVAMTPIERMARSRAARSASTIELPATVLAQLDAVAQRDGDASRVAVVARLVQAELGSTD